VKQIYTAEGMRRLRGAWMLLAGAIASSTLIIAGSYEFLNKERRDAAAGRQRLQDARARLTAIQREHQSLDESAETYRKMRERGLLQPERRLDLIELMSELRNRHRVSSVDYEIAPQRPLALASDRSFAGVDILASRVRLRIRGVHEGDVLGFIESLGAAKPGFHPIDRCSLKRIDAPAGDATQPRVEAECTLEWITLKEKRDA
jgi:hypothetical protein